MAEMVPYRQGYGSIPGLGDLHRIHPHINTDNNLQSTTYLQYLEEFFEEFCEDEDTNETGVWPNGETIEDLRVINYRRSAVSVSSLSLEDDIWCACGNCERCSSDWCNCGSCDACERSMGDVELSLNRPER